MRVQPCLPSMLEPPPPRQPPCQGGFNHMLGTKLCS